MISPLLVLYTKIKKKTTKVNVKLKKVGKKQLFVLTLKKYADILKIQSLENPNRKIGGEIMRREYDYSKLRGRIIEKLGNCKNYATILGISDTALYNKLNNKVPFNQDEILKSISKDVLDIDSSEVCNYFFTQKVGKNQTK